MAASHSLTVASADADASVVPSNENLTATTPSLCPRSFLCSLVPSCKRQQVHQCATCFTHQRIGQFLTLCTAMHNEKRLRALHA